jgi:hypothetical protein
MFYHTAWEDMDLAPQPIWFMQDERSCWFVIGESPDSPLSPEAQGNCTISDDKSEATFTRIDDPDSPVTLTAVEDYGGGLLEPQAVFKWFGEDEHGTVYVWEKPDEWETDMMFYWTGFAELGYEAMPIWFFVTEDSCAFSIGIQYNYDPESIGGCVIADDYSSA